MLADKIQRDNIDLLRTLRSGENRFINTDVVLTLLVAIAPPMIREISEVLRADDEAIGKSCVYLEDLGLVSGIGAGRHKLWALSSKARQLPLFKSMLETLTTGPQWLPQQPLLLGNNDIFDNNNTGKTSESGESALKGGNSALESGKSALTPLVVSSSSIDQGLNQDIRKTTNIHNGGNSGLSALDSGLSALSAETRPLALLMVKHGAQPKQAVAAMQQALGRGESLELIEWKYLSWAVYGYSPAGDGIKYPWQKALRAVELGQFAPDWKEDARDASQWRAWRSRYADELARIDYLDARLIEAEQPEPAQPHEFQPATFSFPNAEGVTLEQAWGQVLAWMEEQASPLLRSLSKSQLIGCSQLPAQTVFHVDIANRAALEAVEFHRGFLASQVRHVLGVNDARVILDCSAD